MEGVIQNGQSDITVTGRYGGNGGVNCLVTRCAPYKLCINTLYLSALCTTTLLARLEGSLESSSDLGFDGHLLF